ncbi:unnamed protein product [Symbiodinium pilosum]|uniref:Sulfotransferase domain-containing protein n=1 Tax=Symbiodinium pilosum TaxID=2952 RepID=A0A812JTU7_SYMPI|nr:unnamed protein product [Symbiodinium pilosum]
MSMLRAKCWPLLWLLCTYASAVVADVSCEEHDFHATQFLQMTSILNAELHSPLKPWDVHYYLGVAYHKAGTYLMIQVWQSIFHALGAKPLIDMGQWDQPCYPGTCYAPDAPIQVWIDLYSPAKAQKAREAAGERGLRVAGFVRDPVSMIVSAYCYHHRGKELWNFVENPQGIVAQMGPLEGLTFEAQRMLPVVKNMTGIFEHPANDTLRLDYERTTASSDGFDSEMVKLIGFLFEDLISAEERAEVLNATQRADLNRHPANDDDNHSNDPDCKARTREYVPAMPSDLLGQYRSFQQRLGYAPS